MTVKRFHIDIHGHWNPRKKKQCSLLLNAMPILLRVQMHTVNVKRYESGCVDIYSVDIVLVEPQKQTWNIPKRLSISINREPALHIKMSGI